MPNPRLQSILASKVAEYVKEANSTRTTAIDASRGYTELMLEEIWHLDRYTVEDSIVDGGQEKGMDALFEDELESDNVLYVVQSLYRVERPDRGFEETKIIKLITGVSEYILNDYPIDNLNPRLKAKIPQIRASLAANKIQRVCLVALTNGQPPSESGVRELESFAKVNPEVFYQVLSESDLQWVFQPDSAAVPQTVQVSTVVDPGAGTRPYLSLDDINTA